MLADPAFNIKGALIIATCYGLIRLLGRSASDSDVLSLLVLRVFRTAGIFIELKIFFSARLTISTRVGRGMPNPCSPGKCPVTVRRRCLNQGLVEALVSHLMLRSAYSPSGADWTRSSYSTRSNASDQPL